MRTNVLLAAALMVGSCCADAQTATLTTSSGARSTAIGGGAATSISGGGAGGNGGNVTVNVDPAAVSGDPPSGAANANAQQLPSGGGDPTIHEDIRTVGNPGAVSYGVSFSQFNCANTAAVGAGFLGGVFQFGGGVESNPCNDRANASALYQIAGALATQNKELSGQLYHAAILLIGNSTKETQAALAAAGVHDWVTVIAPSAAAAESTGSVEGLQPAAAHVAGHH